MSASTIDMPKLTTWATAVPVTRVSTCPSNGEDSRSADTRRRTRPIKPPEVGAAGSPAAPLAEPLTK